MIDAQSCSASADEAREPAFSIRGLSYCYPGEYKSVLSNVSFDVTAGTFTAIVGRSGCGKTTLLNLLAGYLLPTQGSCHFGGAEIVGPAPSRIPIFQVDGLLLWLRVQDNIMLHVRLNEKRKPVSADFARMEGLLTDVGLDPDQVRRVYPKALSEGMKKRVELARALFPQPKAILADEPFASLDMDTRESLHRLIERIWCDGRLTIIISTHDLHEALYLASEVIVLSPETPATLAGRFANPFQGDVCARRERAEAYYSLFDRIRSAMREERMDE